ncbi:MAG TPA: hypothetical protein DCQ94_12085 [Nitrospira sp.]|nr:hypothetical protein [Nitrospira sp.]
MNEPQVRDLWGGPAGRIELIIDRPAAAPRGAAIIAHPHPLLGGNAEHKVPAMLARTLRNDGWMTLRPNFRGVGATEGEHDEGNGEADDLVAVAARLRDMHADLPLVLIGFSFGGYVQIAVSQKLVDSGAPPMRLVLVGAGIGHVEGSRVYVPGNVPPDTLIIHGEKDERVPLCNVMRWAEPQGIPVVVVPGADHFFARRLPVLTRFVLAHLKGDACNR